MKQPVEPSRDPDQCKTPMTRLVDGNKDKAKVSEQIFLSRPSCHVLVVETTFYQFRVKICAENTDGQRGNKFTPKNGFRCSKKEDFL